MRHAGTAALDRLEPLLARLREQAGLRERSRGVFYRGSKAWLHFHEDPAGSFGDLRTPGGWNRLPVASPEQQQAFLAAVELSLEQAGA